MVYEAGRNKVWEKEKEMKAKHDQEFKREKKGEKAKGNPLEKEMKDEENMSGVHQMHTCFFLSILHTYSLTIDSHLSHLFSLLSLKERLKVMY